MFDIVFLASVVAIVTVFVVIMVRSEIEFQKHRKEFGIQSIVFARTPNGNEHQVTKNGKTYTTPCVATGRCAHQDH